MQDSSWPSLDMRTEAHIQQEEIPKALIQQLIDAAYTLGVATHYEDVLEDGVERPVMAVLRQFKQRGFEPTGYSSDGDPDLLLGRPLWASESNKERRTQT
jgi:hypothetical protein